MQQVQVEVFPFDGKANSYRIGIGVRGESQPVREYVLYGATFDRRGIFSPSTEGEHMVFSLSRGSNCCLKTFLDGDIVLVEPSVATVPLTEVRPATMLLTNEVRFGEKVIIWEDLLTYPLLLRWAH